MPRYHFNIDDHTDADGAEMESLAQAKCEAIRTAGQTICHGAEAFWNNAEWKMSVTDASGLILFDLLIIGTESAAGGLRQRSPSTPRTGRENVMTIYKLLFAGALGLIALGSGAAKAQDRTYSSGAQQQDRTRENNRGSGRSDHEGARHAEEQQGRGYNAPDSYPQRGGGHHGGRYVRAARGHGSHCRVRWHHHRRARVCG